MIFLPYGVLFVFCIITVSLLNHVKDKWVDPRFAGPQQLLFLTLGTENLYYGLPREWPAIYEMLAWFWPAVLLFKTLYSVALAWYIFLIFEFQHKR